MGGGLYAEITTVSRCRGGGERRRILARTWLVGGRWWSFKSDDGEGQEGLITWQPSKIVPGV